jgi:hypothetical protein
MTFGSTGDGAFQDKFEFIEFKRLANAEGGYIFQVLFLQLPSDREESFEVSQQPRRRMSQSLYQ